MNKIIFSGIQPTNKISIGNYFSIIKSLIKLQNNYKCLLMIADYHALASGVCKSELNKNVKNCIATCIASGMDPEKITIDKTIEDLQKILQASKSSDSSSSEKDSSSGDVGDKQGTGILDKALSTISNILPGNDSKEKIKATSYI